MSTVGGAKPPRGEHFEVIALLHSLFLDFRSPQVSKKNGFCIIATWIKNSLLSQYCTRNNGTLFRHYELTGTINTPLLSPVTTQLATFRAEHHANESVYVVVISSLIARIPGQNFLWRLKWGCFVQLDRQFSYDMYWCFMYIVKVIPFLSHIDCALFDSRRDRPSTFDFAPIQRPHVPVRLAP